MKEYNNKILYNNLRIENLELLKRKNKHEKVYTGFDNLSKKKVIIKTFDKQNYNSQISFLREQTVNFNHKNINKLLDFGDLENLSFVTREYLIGKDLAAYKPPFFSTKKSKTNFYINSILQVVEGLKFLHSKNIIHRDIRPANLFFAFNKDEKAAIKKPMVKLIDFGMVKAKTLEETDDLSPYALIFSPPEQVLRFNNLVNQTSDIYALGVTLWILLSGKMPFNHKIPEIVATLQLTYDLQKNTKIDNCVYKVIKKATYKAILKKPYNKYKKSELLNLFSEAQQFRYQTVKEFGNDLKKCIK